MRRKFGVEARGKRHARRGTKTRQSRGIVHSAYGSLCWKGCSWRGKEAITHIVAVGFEKDCQYRSSSCPKMTGISKSNSKFHSIIISVVKFVNQVHQTIRVKGYLQRKRQQESNQEINSVSPSSPSSRTLREICLHPWQSVHGRVGSAAGLVNFPGFRYAFVSTRQ